MNDRYLFRGKRINDGKWAKGHYIGETTSGHSYLHINCTDYETMLGTSIQVDSVTIGQCTGLRDKNGTLIFEGDIVKTKEFGKNSEIGINHCGYDIFSVVFHVNAYCVENGEESNGRRFGLSSCYGGCEIIGNIHDNPELMEV